MSPRPARSSRFTLRWLAASLIVVPLLPSAVSAGAWDVFTNANSLESVAALDPYVWAPSLAGVHRFDPATGTFVRTFHEPGTLGSNHVVAVARDADSTIWFATDAGASLLGKDGSWRSVGTAEGLPSGNVTTLEAAQGGMWVGTEGGLAFFVGTTLQGVWPDGFNPTPFTSNVIRDVATFGARTWVATANGVYTTTAGVVWDSVSTNLTPRDVVSISHDGTTLWAVTSDGSVWSGGETGVWTQTETGLTAAGRRLAAGGGSLVLGAEDGVWRWDGSGSTWVSMGGPAGASVDLSGAGTIWAGNDQGLWRWNGSTWDSYRSTGPVENWQYGMTIQGGSVYFACRNSSGSAGGVSRYDDARGWRHFVGSSDPDTSFYPSPFVVMAGSDREGFKWFADWDGSIARLDDRGAIPQFTHFFADTVRFTYGFAFAHDPQGPRWIGLDTPCRGCGGGFEPLGLLRIDNDGTRTNFQPTNSAMTSLQIRAIAYAPDGTMWVGYADFGVDLFTDRNLQTRVTHLTTGNGLRTNNVWAITFSGNTAWVLTDGGVSRFTAGSGVPQFVSATSTPEISSQGALDALVLDPQGGAWVATTRGLFRINPDGTTALYTTANSPLVSNDVHSLALDPASGDLWIGTIEGINRLRPSGLTIGTGASTLFLSPNPLRLSGSSAILRLVAADGTVFAHAPIEIRDVRGRVVASLRSDARGYTTWNGVTESGRRLPAGVYFVRVVAYGPGGVPNARAQARMVLLP